MEKKLVDDLILWIKDYVKQSGAKGVTIGMSGGKDSFVVAKLCCEAVGKENVFGLILPNGEMSDKNDAVTSCEFLQIPYRVVNIDKAYNHIINEVEGKLANHEVSDVTKINTAPRLRMTTIYAFAGSQHHLVANTSNLSEGMVGYCTKWGDNVGDFAPIANFTKSEVCEIGILLGLPQELVYKKPSDGLSGKTDEEKLGFSYDELDKFIRNGVKGPHFDLIEKKHKFASHKLNPISKFQNGKINHFYN